MAPQTNGLPLSAEPAKPEEREKQDLPPKSYKDAVEVEASPEAEETNGVDGHDEGMNGSSKKIKHKASVLKIVDTHPEGEEQKGNENEKEKKDGDSERPTLDRQESKHEYSATVSYRLSWSCISGGD
jgi:2-acylglycerol O-acyltransferase 2